MSHLFRDQQEHLSILAGDFNFVEFGIDRYYHKDKAFTGDTGKTEALLFRNLLLTNPT